MVVNPRWFAELLARSDSRYVRTFDACGSLDSRSGNLIGLTVQRNHSRVDNHTSPLPMRSRSCPFSRLALAYYTRSRAYPTAWFRDTGPCLNSASFAPLVRLTSLATRIEGNHEDMQGRHTQSH